MKNMLSHWINAGYFDSTMKGERNGKSIALTGRMQLQEITDSYVATGELTQDAQQELLQELEKRQAKQGQPPAS